MFMKSGLCSIGSVIAVKLSSEMLSKSTLWEENSQVEKRSLPSGGDTLLSGKEWSSMGELGEWPKLYADEPWPRKADEGEDAESAREEIWAVDKGADELNKGRSDKKDRETCSITESLEGAVGTLAT